MLKKMKTIIVPSLQIIFNEFDRIRTLIGAYIWCTLLVGAGFALGSEYIQALVISVFGASAYLLYQYRTHLPSLAWIYTRTNNNKMDNRS